MTILILILRGLLGEVTAGVEISTAGECVVTGGVWLCALKERGSRLCHHGQSNLPMIGTP